MEKCKVRIICSNSENRLKDNLPLMVISNLITQAVIRYIMNLLPDFFECIGILLRDKVSFCFNFTDPSGKFN